MDSTVESGISVNFQNSSLEWSQMAYVLTESDLDADSAFGDVIAPEGFEVCRNCHKLVGRIYSVEMKLLVLSCVCLII